ncbi:hypothetical protein [Aliivibrio fischeri]|uniref:hypothetical protein n=1 Tax=Aliivibrio fischeri TaxID=668 RepID=UPI001F261BF1|nr:hypothetical protein [Aliivibrio fischeri]MCE7556423.1 hypothetical protein [Aliivibrio fischeri]MCE7563012.1 hypothetical protein [Aliivibrio fischeri]MCE7571304.1 hypothetical protein [Aliivibrio fischeri]
MKFGREIILVLIGGIIAIAGNYWIQSIGKQIPYIDKYVQVEKSIMSKKNLLSHDVKIFVDKEEVTKVSKANVYLLNYSNQFFKDMEVSIELDIPDDNFKILSLHAVGENQQENMVERIDNEEDNLFNYQIKSAKRTDSYDEFFQLIIYYEGDYDLKESDFIITVLNAEARVRTFEKSHSPEDTKNKMLNSLLIFVMVCVFVVFLILFITILSRLTHGIDKKANQNYAKRLLDASSSVDEFNKFPIEVRKAIISSLMYQQRNNRWNKMNRFQKLIEGNIEPKVDDFNIVEASEEKEQN